MTNRFLLSLKSHRRKPGILN